MKIQYRALVPKDSSLYRQVRLTSLLLHPECFGSDYQEQAILPKLYFETMIEENSQENIMLGAFFGRELIGLCGLKAVSTEAAEIVQMYVDSSYRGNNIGVNLVSLAKDYAVSRLEVSKLMLVVYTENISAINAYEKAGFQIDKRESGGNEGELYMTFVTQT
ncbi:GNAT family N-acetyltransferase [Thaumasiovibrio sp. DFM-14]|uniref:GNAT family N-acetyltransferase n=1 Tax=Thaumasiovibrio sp. DFM-14 TaxID=3384792 RepID=UPI0039A13D51